MTVPLLHVTDLSIAFAQAGGGRFDAVKHVSFDIARGETVALVGESGSGKSVTALGLLQLLPPSASYPSGSIIFDGMELRGAPAKQLRQIRGARIGIIFQEPMTALNPLHTIEKQINEILLVHKRLSRRAARARTLELLDLVGIKNAARRLAAYPHELSGGQRQRVMIAMALANEPDLLIADEPTTALDVTVQAQILQLLKDLQAKLGMALLLITHDLNIVRHMAARVCVMKSGEIVEQGETTTLFAAPQHTYTKMLLGTQPKGAPQPVASDASQILTAQNLKIWFPIKSGFFMQTKDYVRAVNDVSLMLRAGETLGVVGESGSGKSTLGYALLRLIKSTGGEILFETHNLRALSQHDMRPLRKDLQIVFQDPFGALSPRLTVAQIIGEGLGIHRPELTAAEREARVCDILTEVGLDPGVRHRYPHEFSGGQRQRIAIARAMILQPRFVVLDEPTSALDMSVQAQIVDLLRNLQQKYQLSYLFISHDLHVVRAMSHRIIVMKDGEVVETGAAADIFAHPQHPYTQKLLVATLEHRAA